VVINWELKKIPKQTRGKQCHILRRGRVPRTRVIRSPLVPRVLSALAHVAVVLSESTPRRRLVESTSRLQTLQGSIGSIPRSSHQVLVVVFGTSVTRCALVRMVLSLSLAVVEERLTTLSASVRSVVATSVMVLILSLDRLQRSALVRVVL